MYISMYVFMYVLFCHVLYGCFVCILYAYICMYLCIFVCVYVCFMYICMCVYMYIHVCPYMPASMYVLVHTFVGTIALSYPTRVRVRSMVKLSAAFFHESSITIGGGGYKSAIAPFCLYKKVICLSCRYLGCYLLVWHCSIWVASWHSLSNSQNWIQPLAQNPLLW